MEGFSEDQGSTLNNQLIQDTVLYFSYPSKSYKLTSYAIKMTINSFKVEVSKV